MDRRSLLTGLVTAIAAPAIVPIKSLMAMPRAPVFVPDSLVIALEWEAGQLYVELIKSMLANYNNCEFQTSEDIYMKVCCLERAVLQTHGQTMNKLHEGLLGTRDVHHKRPKGKFLTRSRL